MLNLLNQKTPRLMKKLIPRRFRSYLRGHLGLTPSSPVIRHIHGLDELDKELERVFQRFGVSDDEGRRALSEFCYVIDADLPADPYSREYYDAQMSLYSAIAGKKYSSANERSYIDSKSVPFPYYTKSATTVGDQLIAQGFLIRSMGLPPGSRIVEFGPGWGNTTMHLCQMGYSVTAVEVERAFVDVIQYRGDQLGQKVELVNCDMLDFCPKEKYDAALFFECFHHCSDHLRMLRNLKNIIKETGLICFASEPITQLPYPWGLRLDGMSVWSIRSFGWLELGFDTAYFVNTLAKLGLTCQRICSEVSPLTDVIIARKATAPYTSWTKGIKP
jgi:2-polyprenyl-3-methyl-5-hydroxy-6-metoxy-1,4-benzoquinol methylase